MITLSHITETLLGGNEPWQVWAFVFSIIITFVFGCIGHHLLALTAKKFQRLNKYVPSAFVGSLAKTIDFAAFAIGLRIGFGFLTLGPQTRAFIDGTISILLVLTATWLVYRLVDVVICWLEQVNGRIGNRLDNMLIPLVRGILRFLVIIFAFLQIATYYSDKPLTSILAGLGIGGLAVALAAQDTIKNFFGSMVIFVDKPFALGDTITVDNNKGTVESVGIRSTRLRTLDGYQLTVPNSDLANKTIVNIDRRAFIRRVGNITINYRAGPEKVNQAIEIIKEILTNHEGQSPDRPPRVYFEEFKDTGMNIVFYYWYHPPDTWNHLSVCSQINLEIVKRFEEAEIPIATTVA